MPNQAEVSNYRLAGWPLEVIMSIVMQRSKMIINFKTTATLKVMDWH